MDEVINSHHHYSDLAFLIERATRTGSVSFTGNRDTVASSNSIVSIAYGQTDLKNQQLPSDISDMESCENMWKKLPEHRKIGDALIAMKTARDCNYFGKSKAP